jgi:hypothetical protein
MNYLPILVIDKPTPIGWSGDDKVQYPPIPDRSADYETGPPPCSLAEMPIEALEGSIVDMSAPFLNETQVVSAAHKIKKFIDETTGNYRVYSFAGPVGSMLLPGMRAGTSQEVIHSVEFAYNDMDSVTTNVTVGPKYFEPGGYSDSKYVKKTETITRIARVIGASNSKGEFAVSIDGMGVFNACNGITESIYPGDWVDVKVTNFPVEP